MYSGYFLKRNYTTMKILQRYQKSCQIKAKTIKRIEKRRCEKERQERFIAEEKARKAREELYQKRE